MSEQGPGVQRWKAPYFKRPAEHLLTTDPVEQEALAHEKGFDLGKKEGLESGRAEAEQTVRHMAVLLESMAHPFLDLDHLVTKELTQLSMLIARQVIRRELSINSDVVTDIVDEAMRTLSRLEGDIEIYLNPADMVLVRELATESLEGVSWSLVEDPNMLAGGCRIKTPLSLVDASVEKQMELVFGKLLESCENKLDY